MPTLLVRTFGDCSPQKIGMRGRTEQIAACMRQSLSLIMNVSKRIGERNLKQDTGDRQLHTRSSIGSILLLVLWIALMVGIFWFSSRTAYESTQESYAVGTLICRILDAGFDELTPQEQLEAAEAIDHFVRKSAHFCEYMVLGLMTACVFLAWIAPRLKGRLLQTAGVKTSHAAEGIGVRKVRQRTLLYAELWCILYAASDEWHQTFVPGRYGMWQDVVLDSIGALVGILIVYAVRSRIAHQKQ